MLWLPGKIARLFGKIKATYREAFSGIPGRIWILAGVSLVNRCGTMVLTFLSLYLTQHEGFTPSHAGQVLGIYGLGAILGASMGGGLSDRFPPVRIQVFSFVAGGIGFVLLGTVHGLPAFLLVALLSGALGELFRPATFAAVAQFSAPELRPRAFALIRLAVNLGMAVGPVLGGFLAAYNYHFLFWVDAVTSWLAAVILWKVLWSAKTTQPIKEEVHGTISIPPWRDRSYMIFAALFLPAVIAFFQLAGTFQLYLRQVHGYSELTIGLLLGINTLLIAVTEMALVHSVRKIEPLRVISLGILLLGGGFALMPFGSSIGFIAFTVVVWTVGEMLTFPQTQVLTANRASDRHRGKYMALYTLIFSVGFSVGPFLGLTVYQHFGPNVVWYAEGIIASDRGGRLRLVIHAVLPSTRGSESLRYRLSSSFAASDIISIVHGGSQTRSILTDFTPGTDLVLFSVSSGSCSAAGQLGAVSVIFTST